MKKLVIFLFFFSILLFAAYLFYPHFVKMADYSYCDSAITYKIGSVAKEFNISDAEFNSKVLAAAKIWNDMYSTGLLEYSPEGTVTVELVYDERQRALREVMISKDLIFKSESELDALIIEYESDRAKLETSLQALNDEISSWNSKGGAPKDVFDALLERQRSLRKEINDLNAFGESVNFAVEQFNYNVQTHNSAVEGFNEVIDSRPEGGLYNPGKDKIEIFLYDSDDQLVSTLAHEFGHALNLGHTTNENSIMFTFANQNTTPSDIDKKMLKERCRVRNGIEEYMSEISSYLSF